MRLIKDPDNFVSLAVSGPDGQSISLFLGRDEVTRLNAADKDKIYEIRYLYSEDRSENGSVNQLGELESIRDDHDLLIDHSRCRLHGDAMVRRPVHIAYGLPSRSFLESMNRDFPNAAIQLGGCVISPDSPTEAPSYVCPKCEAARQAWAPPKKTDE